MNAVIKGITVTGTLQEIMALIKLHERGVRHMMGKVVM